MAALKATRVRAAIRAIVKLRGSGAAAAMVLGVSPTAVNACLRGDTGPSRGLAEKTARAWGVTVEQLYASPTADLLAGTGKVVSP